MIKWENKIIQISDLQEWDTNPRKMIEEDFQELCNSLEKLGHARTITVNPKNGIYEIIGGNQTLKALKKLKYKKINCSVPNRQLTEKEKRELSIKLNHRDKGEGKWDFDKLQSWNINELNDWGIDLPIEFIENDVEIKEDNYEIPKTIETNIKQGDLFKIGNHFLLCGDTTKKADIDILLKTKKADCIFTDPPYDLEDNYSQNIFNYAKDDCHIFIMNSDKLLVKIVNNNFQWFRRFFAVDFRRAHLISNKQPMTRVDFIAEFNKGKSKFNNLRDGFSTLIECVKIHNNNENINFGHKQAKKLELPAIFIEHYSNKNELICDFKNLDHVNP